MADRIPQPPYRFHLLPCSGKRCTAEMGEAMKGRLKDLMPDRKALGVRISTSSCQGMCELGPNLIVYPQGVVYHGLQVADLDEIVEQVIRGAAAQEADDVGDN